MTLEELHIEPIVPLREDDMVLQALDRMEELKISHLPLVAKDGKYRGLISEDQLYEVGDDTAPVAAAFNPAFAPSVPVGAHAFDVLGTCVQHRITLIPVVDSKDQWVSAYLWSDVAEWFRNAPTLVQPGAILTLQLESQQYSLTEIAGIVEQNDSKIIGLWVSPPQQGSGFTLTLKLSTELVLPIVQSLARYGYTVEEVYGDTAYEQEEQSRLDNLMNFLKF